LHPVRYDEGRAAGGEDCPNVTGTTVIACCRQITVVPVEKLTDEELAFYHKLLASGRATPIDVPALTAKAGK
jgi:hypothetical protein